MNLWRSGAVCSLSVNVEKEFLSIVYILLAKKYAALYWTRWLIIVFTGASLWSLTWVRWIQSTSSRHTQDPS
jgi:hypothetical protein